MILIRGGKNAGQRARPSLPAYVPSDAADLTPMTAEERAWVTENMPLIRAAVRQRRIGVTRNVDDVVGLVTFCVVKSLRAWRPDGGCSRATFVWNMIRRRAVTRHYERHLHLCPYVKGMRSRDPVLFGKNDVAIPDPSYDEAEDATELMDKLADGYAAFTERERDMLALFLGFDGPRHAHQSIAEKYGITRERVRQVIDRCLDDLRKWCGLGHVGKRAPHSNRAVKRQRCKAIGNLMG